MARQSLSPLSRPLSRLLPLLAITTLPLLAGCGGGAGYPSLARRPAELLGAEGQALPRCPHATEACPDPSAPLPPRVTGVAPVVAPAPAPAPPPPAAGSISTRLAAYVAEARAAHATFLGKRAAAQAAARAAAGAEPGSDGWASATTALSELQSAHGAALSALAGIDALNVADRVAQAEAGPGTDSADTAAIRDATTAVAALLAEEDAALDPIRAEIRQ
ncbi:MAG: hypothetical protein KGN34_11090 [Sphingomonadales bacterium]|nr:hypothetical protein [Sphingomonadales bacterium]